MSQKHNIMFYAIIVALVLVLPGQAVAVEDACSFIQDVNERVACEKIEPFPRACSVIKNDIDQGNCEKFNKRMATGMSSNTPPPPPPPCNGPPGHECDQNADGTPVMHGGPPPCNGPPGHECDQNPDGSPIMLSGPPPWCTGKPGSECENDDGTPIQPPMQDPCATIQDVNERLKCQGIEPKLGAGVPIEMPGVPTHEPGGGFYIDEDGNKVFLSEREVLQREHDQHKAEAANAAHEAAQKAAAKKLAEQAAQAAQEAEQVAQELREVAAETRSAAGEARTAADNADKEADESVVPAEAGAARVAAGEARAAADNADNAVKTLELLLQSGHRDDDRVSALSDARAKAQGAREAAVRAKAAAKAALGELNEKGYSIPQVRHALCRTEAREECYGEISQCMDRSRICKLACADPGHDAMMAEESPHEARYTELNQARDKYVTVFNSCMDNTTAEEVKEHHYWK